MTPEQLRKLRKEAKLSQEKLAHALGYKRGKVTISEWEKKRVPISANAQQRLINFFNEQNNGVQK